MSRLWREERGQASTELMGTLMWLLLAAVGVWQILLATWTITQASNAARTGSRTVAKHGDPAQAAKDALTHGLRDGARIRVRGETVTVRVPVPIVFPGLHSDRWTVSRSAELPQ